MTGILPFEENIFALYQPEGIFFMIFDCKICLFGDLEKRFPILIFSGIYKLYYERDCKFHSLLYKVLN